MTVTLIPVAPEHAENMYRWVCDPTVSANIGLRRVPSPQATREWIARSVADESISAHAILRDGAHVGTVVLDQIDRWLRAARLSIYVGEPAARGTGVGRAALRQILAEAFGRLRLHRVQLTVHCKNAAAIAAYLDVGFLVEGTLRDGFLLEGKYVDAFLMSVLEP